MVDDTAIFFLRGGEVLVQCAQLRLVRLHAREMFSDLLAHRTHDSREFSQFVLSRQDRYIRRDEAV